MTSNERAIHFTLREDNRERQFNRVWTEELDDVFSDVTLQYASRHLPIMNVSRKVRRVPKPGGYFYHCDMLRPANKIVQACYYAYLRFCLNFTRLLFQSSPATHGARKYFIEALRMFYSAEELSDMPRDIRFEELSSQAMLSGMVGNHRAMKPLAAHQ